MRILVTGATGTVGGHLVAQLHAEGHEVRALTRDPSRAVFPPGVEAFAGDLTDTASLVPAFDGAEAIHLITFGGEGYGDLSNGADIVELAERSGVSRATVLGGWAPTSVESALAGSDIGTAFLQPREFMGNVLDWSEEIRAHGTLSTLATGPSAMVHEADIASVAVQALTNGGHGGQSYALTGPEALTPRAVMAQLAEATGEDITFVQLTEEQERKRLRGFGYDEEYVEFGIQLAMDPPDVAGVVLSTVEDVTGASARTFARWAEENADRFRRAV